jgi:hypothetical protein
VQVVTIGSRMLDRLSPLATRQSSGLTQGVACGRLRLVQPWFVIDILAGQKCAVAGDIVGLVVRCRSWGWRDGGSGGRSIRRDHLDP